MGAVPFETFSAGWALEYAYSRQIYRVIPTIQAASFYDPPLQAHLSHREPIRPAHSLLVLNSLLISHFSRLRVTHLESSVPRPFLLSATTTPHLKTLYDKCRPYVSCASYKSTSAIIICAGLWRLTLSDWPSLIKSYNQPTTTTTSQPHHIPIFPYRK